MKINLPHAEDVPVIASRTLTMSAIAALTLAPGVEVNAAATSLVRICSPTGVRLVSIGGDGQEAPNHGNSSACHAGCLSERPKVVKQGERGSKTC